MAASERWSSLRVQHLSPAFAESELAVLRGLVDGEAEMCHDPVG